MATSAPRKAALTVDHLLRLEEIGEAALSPDGRWLAYVVKRPCSTATFHKYEFLFGGDRGDVWLVEIGGGAPQNLTGGAAEGSGYWAPSWSPDSARLAMLSTRGGNVHLWGCDLDSGRTARLCSRPVDVYKQGNPSVWVSERNLLVPTLPAGERPTRMTVEVQAAEVAMTEWPKAWKGDEPTASALESGLHAPFDERPQGELRLVDAANGREETVLRGFFRDLQLAPDGHHVSFLRQVDVIRPQAGEELARTGPERVRVGIVTPDGEVTTTAIEGVKRPVGGSLRWSPDGAELAVVGRMADSSPARAFRYRPSDGHLEALTDESLEPSSVLWTHDREILALAKRVEPEGDARADWWLASRDGPRKLSGGLSAVPSQLFPEQGRESFVGLAAGQVLRLSLRDGRWATLATGVESEIAWLVWPTQNVPDSECFDQLVVALDGEPGWHSLDLRSGALRSLSRSATRGWRLQFAPEHATAVTVAVDGAGARLAFSKPAFEDDRLVHETNAWLRDVAEGEVVRVEYRGLGGEDLAGWLILPVGHEQGSRHPLITAVFPGLVFSGATAPNRMVSKSGHHAFNLQLLAARRYAVLLPSMPLAREGEPSNPYLELTKGALPAIDKVIEMGIADPDRLGVIGQSRGGFGTYGLITQTPRFKAAVALAGYADLVSLYGEFDPRFRYDDYAHEHGSRMILAESGQHRLGTPPWKDPQRYVRNSPLFHADRVETPLLIIQGDMDYVPLQQGEQFFSALYRQGKRARFVRYWGEGHVFQSPANLRSLWEEIYSWFDEFLQPAEVTGPSRPSIAKKDTVTPSP